jgi:hypothetical protein
LGRFFGKTIEMAEKPDTYKDDPAGMSADALARRAAALRDNLAKRKAQQKARAHTESDMKVE